MKKIRIASLYIGILIAAMSVSSCVYHSRAPYYDNGYGYGGGYGYRAPGPVVVVRPTPPPRVMYRNNYRSRRNYDRHSYRSYNRQRNNRYGHNDRGHGPR
ncbi:hypothetical protein [Dyadobacter frigoris]|uniref:Lipoprotein n=1 Tax=Dyadobacter frigoris TaxID=2576211 RepID=A0A4U6D989_9BACT|nr:hypothetical protein [Dyadobacter frigoris]TKT94082.1 hypothetical protein FDK13_02410 [Dyadobacter frigoris]GLU50708.1 hypothetical protein Dfri01_01690 [Dyadobacter frigoris]